MNKTILCCTLCLTILGASAIQLKCITEDSLTFGFNACKISNVSLRNEADVITFTGDDQTKSQIDKVSFVHSEVTYLPTQVLKNYPRLQVLSIENSNLQKIAKGSFKDSPSFLKFYGGDNKLTKIETGVFSDAFNMDTLDLKNNLISSFEDGAFRGLSKLTVLDLQGNRIIELPENIFLDLASLDYLWMQNNQIDYLSEGLFKKTNMLTNVDFSGNKIRMIDPVMFDHTKILYSIKLNGNICTDKEFVSVQVIFQGMKEELKPCFDNFYASDIFANKFKHSLI